MRSERGSSRYSPTGLRSEAAGGVTTARWSTRSSSSSRPERSGFTLPERYSNWSGRLQPAADVGRRRYLGAGVYRADGPGRRRRGPRLGCFGGLHDCACPPARGRGLRKGARPESW